VERSETGRADDPLIGRVLDGRYQIGEQVARGGMATVYQAQDRRGQGDACQSGQRRRVRRPIRA
jgi:serine/threonine protein kinase